MLTVDQVAQRLQFSEPTVPRLPLPRYSIGRCVRYKVKDVDEFVNHRVEYPVTAGKQSVGRPCGSHPTPSCTWEKVQARIAAERKHEAKRETDRVKTF